MNIDLMRIATDRRANLRRELEKLDEFIRMAESLIYDAGEPRAEDGDILSPRTSTPRAPRKRLIEPPGH